MERSRSSQMAEYSTEIMKRGAFVLSGERIKAIFALITDFLDAAPRIVVIFYGGYKIESADIEEALTDPYVGSKQIHTIEISGHNKGRRISLRLGVNYDVARLVPIELDIVSTDHDAMIVTRNGIEEAMQAGMQWFSGLMLPNVLLALMSYLLAVPIVTGLFVAGINWFFHLDMISEKRVSLYLVLTWLALTVAVFYAKQQMFPKMVFEVGKSAKIAKRAEYWRNVVGVGIILAFVIGMVSAVFVERMK
jgi:hypothetical protein